ncbi:hypothetical protein [Dokdonella sp.]|uniref:hypothetical protein n=1 Tax=Dokdonella sp. TaxID=2291710 RepID=UPI00378476BA
MSLPQPSLSNDLRLGIFLILGLLMAATRSHHFAVVPDASWAVFFVAGFYFSAAGAEKTATPGGLSGRAASLLAFALLMALAVLTDFYVIRSQGIDFWSHYCVSPAYWFLVPSYAALWFGGAWLRAHRHGLQLRDLGLLVASAVVAASACYLVSNGSFYWISASVPARSFGGWIENLGDWYLPFVQTTLMYIGIAAALHVATVVAAKALVGASASRAAR